MTWARRDPRVSEAGRLKWATILYMLEEWSRMIHPDWVMPGESRVLDGSSYTVPVVPLTVMRAWDVDL